MRVRDTPPIDVEEYWDFTKSGSFRLPRNDAWATVARMKRSMCAGLVGIESASVGYTAPMSASSMHSVATMSSCWTRATAVNWSPLRSRYCATVAYTPGAGDSAGSATTVTACLIVSAGDVDVQVTV